MVKEGERMTDEKIKEEFEKWYEQPATAEELGLLEQDRDMQAGFCAGFRAAERLAKIEVLEELAKWIYEETTGHTPTEQHIQGMLSKLKDGQ